MNRDEREAALLNWGARSYHIEIKNGVVSHKTGRGPVAGARAMIETSGSIQRRLSATRLVLLGPFALAFLKSKDNRSLWLTIVGDTFEILAELPPKHEAQARQWATRFNNLAMSLAQQAGAL